MILYTMGKDVELEKGGEGGGSKNGSTTDSSPYSKDMSDSRGPPCLVELLSDPVKELSAHSVLRNICLSDNACLK